MHHLPKVVAIAY